MVRSNRYSELIQLAISVAIGSVLAFAGMAKISASTLQTLYFGFDPNQTFLLLLGVVELFLSLFLVINRSHNVAWLIVSLTYLTFLIVSLCQYSSDQNCGCMGDLTVSAFNMRLLSIACLAAAFSVFCWKLMFEKNTDSKQITIRMALGLSAVFSPIVVFAGAANLGVAESGGLEAQNTVVANEYVPATGRFSCSLRLSNTSTESVRLIGFMPSCGTKIMRRMPISVAPHECTVIPIISKLPPNRSTGELKLHCFADVGGRLVEKLIRLRVTLGSYKCYLAESANVP